MLLRTILSTSLAISILGCSDDPVYREGIEYSLTGEAIVVPHRLHIDLNGEMTRIKGSSTDVRTLDAETLEVLWHSVEFAYFATLAPMYGCGGCLDDNVHVIRVTRDGMTHEVSADTNSDYPEHLVPLIITLERLLDPDVIGE